MSKEFVRQMCEMAPDYHVSLDINYTTVRITVTSARKPELKKSTVFRFSDLETKDDVDAVFQDELDELLAVVKSEEGRV